MLDERFSRQARLPEVGMAGQERLWSAELEVRGADGALVEAQYLHRAGIERLTLLPQAEPEAFAHRNAFRFPAPRMVGAGAWRALSKIRRELGIE